MRVMRRAGRYPAQIAERPRIAETRTYAIGSQAADIDRAEAERVYSRRFPQYSRWKATLDPAGLPSGYRFYRFAPARLKILDEAEFGDAVFVEADITRT